MKVYNNEKLVTKGDFARQKFIDKGLNYSDIKMSDFFRLVGLVSEEIENFPEYLNQHPELYGIHTMIISQRKKDNKPVFNADDNGRMKSAFIKVSSHYFEGREAISFNADGWIGFCGWASGTNEIPFINAFNRWLDTLKAGVR